MLMLLDSGMAVLAILEAQFSKFSPTMVGNQYHGKYVNFVMTAVFMVCVFSLTKARLAFIAHVHSARVSLKNFNSILS